MREGVGSRPWLAAVLVFFCLPLFVNLGEGDLDNDEAIYAFAIDRMVATGDWLVPRALPHDDLPFLEKPPLKFWIAAAPIRAGLLPANELGLRFWDAAFGAAAFVYVFLLGTRLINPVAGFAAVLILFAHAPLVFSHGLRSNNMESALVLAYCGGVYHYLRSFDRRRLIHPLAVALYFALAFMTKFVAALFLPLILGLTAITVRDHRRALRQGWPQWAIASAAALALIAPWFAFATARYGRGVWDAMLGVHVYQRFTSYLDPGHLQPWHYYFSRMVDYWESGALALMAAGFVVLVAWTARRIRPEAIVFAFWFMVPMAAISAGTSKLYHYAFPFLPPIALAGGYLAALVLTVGWAPFDRAVEGVSVRLRGNGPRVARLLHAPAVRAILAVAILGCVALALGSLLFGRVRMSVGGLELKSAGVLRPGLAGVAFAVLLGVPRGSRRLILAALVASVLPLQGYRDSLMLLGRATHPRRTASECIRAVQEASPALPRGLHVHLADEAIGQSVFYYFERIRPWLREPSHDLLPALTAAGGDAGSALALDENLVVTLPGPYATCAGGSPRG